MIGGEIIESIQKLIREKVKYDDAPVVVYVDGNYRTVEFISYDERVNVLKLMAGNTPVSYEGLREGWRPE